MVKGSEGHVGIVVNVTMRPRHDESIGHVADCLARQAELASVNVVRQTLCAAALRRSPGGGNDYGI